MDCFGLGGDASDILSCRRSHAVSTYKKYGNEMKKKRWKEVHSVSKQQLTPTWSRLSDFLYMQLCSVYNTHKVGKCDFQLQVYEMRIKSYTNNIHFKVLDM